MHRFHIYILPRVHTYYKISKLFTKLGNIRNIYKYYILYYYITSNNSTHLLIGCWELDLAVNSSGTKKSLVQDVYTIGCHDHLDTLRGFKPVKLV